MPPADESVVSMTNEGRKRSNVEAFQDQRVFSQTFVRHAALYLHRKAEVLDIPSNSAYVLSKLLTPAWETSRGRMSQVRYGQTESVEYATGTLHVTYANTTGRFVAHGETNLQSLDEKTLSTICKDVYIYVAVETPQPVILFNLCKKNAFECPRY